MVGRVLDVETGAPVAGALVALPRFGIVARTDSAGEFVLLNVPVGRHASSVLRLGYVPLDEEVEAGGSDTLTIGIVARAVTLQGLTVADRRVERSMARSRNAVPARVRTVGQQELLASGLATADQLVESRTRVVACPSVRSAFLTMNPPALGATSAAFEGLECVWGLRGYEQLRIFIDDVPAAGIVQLSAYRPADLYTLEMRGAGEVRVYTMSFAERLARKPAALRPFRR